MFTNVWYTAAFSKDVQSETIKVTMLGKEFVLFRDNNGSVSCLSNVCCHRGAPLHMGKCFKNGTVACSQHGWRFNGEGECIEIPAASDPKKIPLNARVDSYPVEERYGMIWVMLGDDIKSASPIPDFSEWDKKGWRWIEYEEIWDANYHWAKFSNLDYVHLPVVHGQTWNGGVKPPEHDVEYIDETSLSTGIKVKTKRASGIWSRLRSSETQVNSRMKFFLPGFTIKVDVEIGGDGTGIRFVVFDMSTPIDENTTMMRFLFGRNFMRMPFADKGALRRNLKNVREDRAIAEMQMPKIPQIPSDDSSLAEPEDNVVREYWNIMKKLRSKGWMIDKLAHQRLEQEGVYSVIPSPARRNGKGSWAFREVPRLKSF